MGICELSQVELYYILLLCQLDDPFEASLYFISLGVREEQQNPRRERIYDYQPSRSKTGFSIRNSVGWETIGQGQGWSLVRKSSEVSLENSVHSRSSTSGAMFECWRMASITVSSRPNSTLGR
jgi:hypothetical protein